MPVSTGDRRGGFRAFPRAVRRSRDRRMAAEDRKVNAAVGVGVWAAPRVEWTLSAGLCSARAREESKTTPNLRTEADAML